MNSAPEKSFVRWQREHPGADLQRWCWSMAAVHSIHSDWAYRNGPLNLPEKYAGEHGWWL